ASAEGKRLFVRYFSSLQLHAHFISVIAPLRLDAAEVEKMEGMIRARLEAVTQSLNEAIDGAEALFETHGITTAASYDTQALEIDVPVISSFGRRYLEVIAKLDQLMPLLQTLEIHEVVKPQAVDVQRALLKRQVRDVAQSARSIATGLRRRMNALAQEAVAVDPAKAVKAGTGEAVDSADAAENALDDDPAGEEVASVPITGEMAPEAEWEADSEAHEEER
ncbi:MAG: DUF1845 domain-containing protein, partial [Azoarcus sp.]|nr:DUF1845 domain-containing protein [Azoarcus sp.]